MRWSVQQADRHTADNLRAVETLRDSPELTRLRHAVQPSIRLFPIRTHLIACLLPTDALIVARILHARADWHALLGG